MSFAQEYIVQGPFQINSDSCIYIQKENDINHPLSLYLERNKVSHKVDSYETNGDTPNIETIFFMQLNNVKNVIILVSWHQKHFAEHIAGDHYQTYGYIFENNRLIPNEAITNDPNLSGENGEFSGEELHFEYRSAESIKKYLEKKFD